MIRNRTNQPRPDNRGRSNHIRLPKNLTANAPFRVGGNKQLVSIPVHNTGLTIRRAVRQFHTSSDTGDLFSFTYGSLFTGFQAELAMNITANARLSLSPEWINVYLLSDTQNSLIVHIFDEPRGSGSNLTNSPFYDGRDSATQSGACSIKVIFPKASTYTVSNNDESELLGLPILTTRTLVAGRIIVDVGGTWTLKSIGGTANDF
jgi:hypothetical protein